MVSNEAYKSARRNAAAHLQVQLSPLNRRAGQATVAGTITRIFVDRTFQLAAGQRISFPQPFYTHREPTAGPSAEAWQRAGFVEVYLDCYEGKWSVACDQLTLLARSTYKPVNHQDAEYWTLPEAADLWDR